MTPEQTQTIERALVTAYVAFIESLSQTKPVRLGSELFATTGVFLDQVLFGAHTYGVCDEGQTYVVFPISGPNEARPGDEVHLSFSIDDDGWLSTELNKLTE